MIKEDYVSFETAKLLKEKGYKGSFNDYYNNAGCVVNRPNAFLKEPEYQYYERVSLQMAMKWLRDVHGIHINVFRYPAALSGDNNEKRKPWWFQYALLKPLNEIDIDSHMTDDEFESAEEAMDYAIKYCIENLIENEN